MSAIDRQSLTLPSDTGARHRVRDSMYGTLLRHGLTLIVDFSAEELVLLWGPFLWGTRHVAVNNLPRGSDTESRIKWVLSE